MNDHDIEIAVNSVTVLMSLSGLGIIALMGMFLHLSLTSILGGNS
jgi:hypothetical protein